MSMRRNDITIAIDREGNVWAAQGGPAIDRLDDHDIATVEDGLYYSQLPHRAAWRYDGDMIIGLPSEAPAGALVIGRQRGMTRAPKFVGRV